MRTLIETRSGKASVGFLPPRSGRAFGLHAIAGLILPLLLVLQPASDPVRDAAPFTAGEFAALVGRFSEPEGYFWNNNYVSNEASYLHPLKKMHELGIHGGVYLGVGPNQNFTYIAQLRPRYAFIIDIRRQNFLEHLMFKALFHYARDRREYLSLLLSRPVSRQFRTVSNYSIDDLVLYFRKAEPDYLLCQRTGARIRFFLTEACRVPLSQEDLDTIDSIHLAFYIRGLSIKYDYIPVPTLGEFLTETDLEGRKRNFLNSDEDFLYLKRYQEENRLVPVVGNFAGSHAIREIGRFLNERDERVTVFYTSNVEQYLLRNMTWPKFIRNVSALPLDARAVFIRAFWSNRVSHPEGVAGYRFTQILQWIGPFLRDYDSDGMPSYRDVVTSHVISLR